MKKTKILFSFLFTIALLFIGDKVEANSIESISMDIFVDDIGDAYVTETWKCNVTQGTEIFHPYYYLGNSTIKDLIVMDGDTQYEQQPYWNTSGTLESKANKSGIHQISNGIELCWGMSEYGSHIYTAKYTITNFVSETTDAQMMYWTLIPYEFSNSIGKAYIKISTNFYIQDTIDVWGYGNYGGTAYVYNGDIEMQSKGTLEKNEYMTILVKFPLGTFNTTNKLDYDFEYYYKKAEEGKIKYKGTFFDRIRDDPIIYNVYEILHILIMVAFCAGFSYLASKIASNEKELNYGTEGKIALQNVQYFRDIPCKGDIYRAYYIGYQYGIIKNKTDLLGAIILKWLKDGLIRIEEKGKERVFKKENTVIVLTETNPESFSVAREKQLFGMLYEASKDGYLENKEFEKWCKKSYSKILSWFDKIMNSERMKLVAEGLIEVDEKGKWSMIKGKTYIATYELKQEAIDLAGLKRYLNEYTLIKEREAVEVQLFEEYLVFAQLMGIEQKVAKQFKDVYPEIVQQSNFSSYDHIMFINVSTHRGISSAHSAKSRAESYSSGGRGFSSRGGGGGSFGGGGGGRRFPLKFKLYKSF